MVVFDGNSFPVGYLMTWSNLTLCRKKLIWFANICVFICLFVHCSICYIFITDFQFESRCPVRVDWMLRGWVNWTGRQPRWRRAQSAALGPPRRAPVAGGPPWRLWAASATETPNKRRARKTHESRNASTTKLIDNCRKTNKFIEPLIGCCCSVPVNPANRQSSNRCEFCTSMGLVKERKSKRLKTLRKIFEMP